MAGIYIHIPFCKQACNYCDFHFSTTLNRKTDLVNALLREIEIRKDYLNKETVSTIYFGGGTPSLLSQAEMDKIMEAINAHFEIEEDAEITMEVNPDDINPTKLKELKSSKINRLSIGVQSFHQKDLEFMNRAHNPQEAIASIQSAQDAGFNNITIDLIYGIQTLSDKTWKDNLETFLSLNLPHLSAYCLTVEPQTALSSSIQKGKCDPVSEDKGKAHFELLMNLMEAHGFIQYEISNFCKEGFQSKHNSSYWYNQKYLGIGPSAHSYNGTSRQWNVANNIKYIKGIDHDNLDAKEETLSQNELFNEYVMTSLRTISGIDSEYVQRKFGKKHYEHLIDSSKTRLLSNDLCQKGNVLTLTNQGKMMSDAISSEMFIL